MRKNHLDAHEEGDGEGADDKEEGDGRQEHWGRNGKGVHENEPILEKQLLTASTSGLLSLRLIWPPASRKPTWGICSEQTGDRSGLIRNGIWGDTSLMGPPLKVWKDWTDERPSGTSHHHPAP